MLASTQFGTIKSADILPSIDISRIKTIEVLIERQCHPHLNLAHA